ncbi:MAG: hypothetical protein JXB49_05875 [Bacteroidales bacterium]|nr:hypothetical protein [Bacteroidales bacterium]
MESQFNFLHEEAKRLEEKTTFQFEALTTDEKLEHLADVCTNRYKINQLVAFEMGKALTMAKKICQENHKSFDKWRADNRKKGNFRISRSLANNFIHVYTCCIGQEDIILKIHLSILYKVCMPSFSDTLRTYLLRSGVLEDMKYRKFQSLLKETKKVGYEVFESETEKISAEKLAFNQCSYTITKAKDTLSNLISVKEQITRRGCISNIGIMDFKEQIAIDTPLARKINLLLIEAIETNIASLKTAIDEADKLLNENQ